MPRLIDQPTVIQAAGNKPKRIEEYAGRVNSGCIGTPNWAGAPPGSSIPCLRLPGIVPAPRPGGGHRVVAVCAPFPGHRGALLHDVFVLDGPPLAGEEEDGAAPLAAAPLV